MIDFNTSKQFSISCNTKLSVWVGMKYINVQVCSGRVQGYLTIYSGLFIFILEIRTDITYLKNFSSLRNNYLQMSILGIVYTGESRCIISMNDNQGPRRTSSPD